MQTVLNQKPSCLLKGGLAFLLRKGRGDETANILVIYYHCGIEFGYGQAQPRLLMQVMAITKDDKGTPEHLDDQYWIKDLN